MDAAETGYLGAVGVGAGVVKFYVDDEDFPVGDAIEYAFLARSSVALFELIHARFR